MKRILTAGLLAAAMVLAACTPPPDGDGTPPLATCFDMSIPGVPDAEFVGPKNTADNWLAFVSDDGTCSGGQEDPTTLVTVEVGEGQDEANDLCDSILGVGGHQGAQTTSFYAPNPGARNWGCFPNL